ncbi:MAG: hypothetical protein LBK95_06640 [Bifidobacteriaceae bacterium]|nr:hypothetical protein [Bifidobacteriaceae bacterium]
MAKDADGEVVSTAEAIDPRDAVDQLPARIQTAWWSEGATGTDLSELKGRSGRIAVALSVQNLTAAPTEVSFESDGLRYRQQALVGVPLTVVATANLGKIDLESVVQDASQANSEQATDGVVSTTASGEVLVQWARLLAPPMLSATGTFNLIVETDGFILPVFDITIQPGLVTDPSVEQLVTRAFGSDGDVARLEESTIGLVLNVNERLQEAVEFVGTVHETLQGDISDLSHEVIAALQSNSEVVLTHLESTRSRMESIQQTTASALTTAGSRTQMSVNSLATAMSQLLGSSGPPRLTEASVAGCSIQLPRFAEDQSRTVTSVVYLLGAQMEAVRQAFWDQNDPTTARNPSASPNCRTALVQAVTDLLGDPSQTAACASASPEPTIVCSVHTARLEAANALNALAASIGGVSALQNRFDIDGLMSRLDGPNGLAQALAALRQTTDDAVATVGGIGNLGLWVTDATALVNAAKVAASGAATELASIEASVASIRGTYQALTAETTRLHDEFVTDPDGIVHQVDDLATITSVPDPVGVWFEDSGTRQALTDLVTQFNLDALPDPPICEPNWALGLGSPTPTLDEITEALSLLNDSACPAAGIAAATNTLTASYGQLAESAEQAHTQAADLQADLGGLLGSSTVAATLQALDSQIATTEALVGPTGAIALRIMDIYNTDALAVPPLEAGGLVSVQEKINEIGSLAAAGGSWVNLVALLNSIKTEVDGLWGTETLQPITDPAECEALPQTTPSEAGPAVIQLTNRLFCANDRFEEGLVLLTGEADGLRTGGSSSWFDPLNEAVETTLGRTSTQIAALANPLAETLLNERQSSVDQLLAAIDGTQDYTRTRLDEAIADFSGAAGQIIDSLSTSMAQAHTDSVEVAQLLARDFANLAANLGGAEEAPRSGLTGKLYGISGQVGDTTSVLEKVDATVAVYGNSRSSELRDINLRSAQFAQAQSKLQSFRSFGAHNGGAATVFVFHLAERG